MQAAIVASQEGTIGGAGGASKAGVGRVWEIRLYEGPQAAAGLAQCQRIPQAKLGYDVEGEHIKQLLLLAV